MEASLIEDHIDPNSRTGVEWLAFPKWTASSLGKVAIEQFGLPAIIESHRADVAFFPGNSLSLFSRTPSVLFVRSLLEYQFPEQVPLSRRLLRKALTPIGVRRAARIVCPSRYIANELRRLLGVSETSVDVIPHGVNPAFLRDEKDDSILDTLQLRSCPYFLYPSALWEYKNHRVLIRALDVLNRRGEQAVVVFAGRGIGVNPRYLEELTQETRAVAAPSRIVLAGHLHSKDLNILYSNAVATLFPSTCESFGNPVVESMARGCPVTAANVYALPEVVGAGGRLLDPHDETQWADEISRLTTDPTYRDARVADAKMRQHDYRYSRAVDDLAGILQQVASGTRAAAVPSASS